MNTNSIPVIFVFGSNRSLRCILADKAACPIELLPQAGDIVNLEVNPEIIGTVYVNVEDDCRDYPWNMCRFKVLNREVVFSGGQTSVKFVVENHVG